MMQTLESPLSGSPLPTAALNADRGEALSSTEPEVLAGIYQDNTNMVIWQRELSGKLRDSAEAVLAMRHGCEIAMRVSPQNVASSLGDVLRDPRAEALARDVAGLVDMFCYLFELKYAGLRLRTLTQAMCPRFHVDHVPCRLVTTYQGTATDWLPHACVDRSKLGPGNEGKPDCESGLYGGQDDIQQLGSGDVALLKGERWAGNEGAGVVHRSPEVPAGESRLLLTLDISS